MAHAGTNDTTRKATTRMVRAAMLAATATSSIRVRGQRVSERRMSRVPAALSRRKRLVTDADVVVRLRCGDAGHRDLRRRCRRDEGSGGAYGPRLGNDAVRSGGVSNDEGDRARRGRRHKGAGNVS